MLVILQDPFLENVDYVHDLTIHLNDCRHSSLFFGTKKQLCAELRRPHTCSWFKTVLQDWILLRAEGFLALDLVIFLTFRWALEVGYEALFDAGATGAISGDATSMASGAFIALGGYTKQSLRRLKGDVLVTGSAEFRILQSFVENDGTEVGVHTVENQLNFRSCEDHGCAFTWL